VEGGGGNFCKLGFGNKASPRGRFAHLPLPLQQVDLLIKKKTKKERYDMTVSLEYVRQIFRGLEGGNDEAFLNHVSDDVDWIVVGTHPLAGHYHAKGELVTGTCAKLAKVLQEDAQLYVEHLFVRDDQAVVILRLLATAKNGMRFDHRYCWIMTFSNKVISKVRSYLDSNMVTQLFRENPISDRYEIKN
jgi:ketosteroid isomerase-like protein